MTASTEAAPSRPLIDLARIGVSLRWRLVRNRARRIGKTTPKFAYAMSAVYGIVNIVGLGNARYTSEVTSERSLVLLLSSLAFGWIFGPILMGGVDETIDPTRLALLPLRSRELFTVQLAAALSGIGPLTALVSLTLGLQLGFAPLGPGAVVVLMASLAATVFIAGAARSVASLLAIAQRSRFGRDFAVLAAALVAGSLFVVGQLATQVSGETADELVVALKWAPWAWSGRAILAVGDGAYGASLLWLAASGLAGACSLAVWARLSAFLLANGERVVHSGRRNRGAALHGAKSVFGAALARQWIYLRRSPNTRVALMFGTAFGVAFPVLQILQHGAGDSPAAAFGVLLAMLANIGATSNLLGFDAGSLWIEALCGGPGRAHMAARSLMALPNLLLPTWLSALVVGVWTGQWAAVGLVSLVAIPVALIVLAQGLVTSLLAPWPLPDRDNPFGNRQGAEGRGASLAIIALSGLASALALSAPIIITAWIGRDESWRWLVPAVGLVWAVGLLWGVVAWIGTRLRGSEAELVAELSPMALN